MTENMIEMAHHVKELYLEPNIILIKPFSTSYILSGGGQPSKEEVFA